MFGIVYKVYIKTKASADAEAKKNRDRAFLKSVAQIPVDGK